MAFTKFFLGDAKGDMSREQFNKSKFPSSLGKVFPKTFLHGYELDNQLLHVVGYASDDFQSVPSSKSGAERKEFFE